MADELPWFRISCIVVTASEAMAIAQLFCDFNFTEKYLELGYPDATLGWQLGHDPEIFVASFLVLMLVVNCLLVLWYGRIEYVVGIIKMIFVVGLIFFNIIINILQRVPHHPYGRYWTWNDPYSFAATNVTFRGTTNGTTNETK